MNNIIELLKQKIEPLTKVNGVDAIVLGGSECINLSNIDSDIDICLYYSKEIDWTAVNMIISSIDDYGRRNILPKPYYWGKILNSGGVFLINGLEIDLCIRETAVIEQVIYECSKGNIKVSYQSGYPFGFCNTYFIAEVNYCKEIYDINGRLRVLKELVNANWNVIINYMQVAYLNEAAFQWICVRKINPNDFLYNKSEINTCLFSLLNVYACESNIMFFHNKHAINRIKAATNDNRIINNLNKIVLLENQNSEKNKLRLLANLILEELQYMKSNVEYELFNIIKKYVIYFHSQSSQ